MKTYGKVIEYDGYNGYIKGIDGNEYLLMESEIVGNELKSDDNVSFEPDVFETPEYKENVARFVRKLEKTDKKSK